MLGNAVLEAWDGIFDLLGTASRPSEDDRTSHIPFFPFSLVSIEYSSLVDTYTPDIVVNCAAITDHEYCEKYPGQAYAVNAEAPAKLARAYPDSYIIHVSTDAVFGPDVSCPDETVLPEPFSVYGKTKWMGERLLLQENPRAAVLRTTIVGLGGRRTGPSLAEWILTSLGEGRSLGLYSDAVFTPVSVWDFIAVLHWCVMQRPSGILHAAGPDRVSKYDFGLALAQCGGFNSGLIRRGLLADSPNREGRRFDQSISSNKLKMLRGTSLPGIEECVAGIIRRK